MGTAEWTLHFLMIKGGGMTFWKIFANGVGSLR